MDIEYLNDKLRNLCEKHKLAQKELGAECAKKLGIRLQNLEAACNVSELLLGRPHPLKGNRLGEFALDLTSGVRIVFKPNQDPVPERNDGGINWAMVNKITIVFIF